MVNPRINEAMFSAERACEQMVLIEDHLSLPDLRCPQCLRKHFLLCLGLLREATQLDGAQQLMLMLVPGCQVVGQAFIDFCNGGDAAEICQQIRDLRKAFVANLF